MTDLEKDFSKDMLNIYKTADRELGYKATRFLQMLSKDGPVKTAKKLISKNGGTEGFLKLWESGRLDLSIENLVLNEKYKALFTDDERKMCCERLEKYKK